MARPTSTGTCSFCHQSFSKDAMTRHLLHCEVRDFAELKPLNLRRRPPSCVYHLRVEALAAPEYWMHLDVPASDTLADLDFFLRSVWLECCGHLSRFRIGTQSYSVSPAPVQFPGAEEERDMNVPLSALVEPGAQLEYEYDLGSPTRLKLRVLSQREEPERDEILRILARNDPPALGCEVCGKPAAEVCTRCRGPKGWLCQECAAEHKCGEDGMLPVVNSPRVGVCGYTGES